MRLPHADDTVVRPHFLRAILGDAVVAAVVGDLQHPRGEPAGDRRIAEHRLPGLRLGVPREQE